MKFQSFGFWTLGTNLDRGYEGHRMTITGLHRCRVRFAKMRRMGHRRVHKAQFPYITISYTHPNGYRLVLVMSKSLCGGAGIQIGCILEVAPTGD